MHKKINTENWKEFGVLELNIFNEYSHGNRLQKIRFRILNGNIPG